MTETIHGLKPVTTVFGPFLRDPDGGLAQELREAFEMGTWCDSHGRIEFGPHYLACLECGHGWPTPEALVADYRQALEGMGLDDWGITAEGITACPHCAHDL